jgi:Ca2+/Na+ antiporter
MLAAAHILPSLSIPIAVVIAIIIVWYGWRLGSDHVPSSRRKIRRMTLLLMLVTLPILVRALSYLDPSIEPTQYVVSWLIILVAMVFLVMFAAIDIFVTAHAHARQQEANIRRDAPGLIRALQNEIEQSRKGGRDA